MSDLALCFAHAEKARAQGVPLSNVARNRGPCYEPGCGGMGFYAVENPSAVELLEASPMEEPFIERRDLPHPGGAGSFLSCLTPISAAYIPRRYGWRPGRKVEA